MFCAISNISSGNCGEDCGFCTQSVFNESGIETFKKKPIEQIVKEAKMAKKNLATGFCLVASGKGLNSHKLDFVCEAAKAVKKEVDIMLIACNGIASKEQLKELKKAGISSYNHNLESSREHYAKICSTHSWDERFETAQNAKEAELMLCCGGLFGLGESKEDINSYIKSLKELEPFSSPVNFFIHHEALKFEPNKLSQEEALGIISAIHQALPETKIMAAGGREQMFGSNYKAMFDAGVSAIVSGDYLTAKGDAPSRDKQMIQELGYKIITECHG